MRRLAGAVLTVTAMAACYDFDADRALCHANGRCGNDGGAGGGGGGWGGGSDAGQSDGGNSDGGGDSGFLDGGDSDAGQLDGGGSDAGLLDGGDSDAGLLDGGGNDAGLTDGGGSDAGFDAGFDAGAPPIFVSLCARFSNPLGNSQRPIDAGVTALALLADGGFNYYPGTQLADGGYRIDGVWTAPFYVRPGLSSNLLTPEFLITSQRDLDLCTDALGHADTTPIAQWTTVSINANGVVPFQSGTDRLSFASLRAGVMINDVRQIDGGPPQGITGVQATMDYRGNPPIDSARQDGALVLHHVPVSVNGANGHTAVEWGFDSTFAVASGQNALFNVSMTQSQQVSTVVTLRRPLFEVSSYAAEFGSGATLTSYGVQVDLLPGGLGVCGPLCGGVTLALMGVSSGSNDWNHNFSYVHPLTQERFLSGSALYNLTLPRPSGGTVPAFAYSRVVTPVSGASVEIAPLLGPPRSVAFAANRLSWALPTQGVANGYSMEVARLAAGAVPSESVARFHTRGTAIVFPPGILEPGDEYLVWAGALNVSGNAYDRQPRRMGLPMAQAVAPSPIFSVGPAPACNPSVTTLGPRGGQDVCRYGFVCGSVSSSVCSPAPGATCAQADGAPRWDFRGGQAPVITRLTAVGLPVTNPITECASGVPGALITVTYYAPNTLTAHTGFTDLQSHLRYSGAPGAPFIGPAFSRDLPIANAQYDTFDFGVCGLLNGTGAVYLIDETGATSNVTCVTW